MNKIDLKNDTTASQRITEHIAELKDWRGKMLAHVRNLIFSKALC